MEMEKYIREEKECVGNNSETTYRKMVAALRQSSSRIGSEPLKKFTRLSEATHQEYLKQFVSAECKKRGKKYLR